MSSNVASFEFLAFRLQQLPGVGSATLRRILARAQRDRYAYKQFEHLDNQVLQSTYGLKLEAIERLHNSENDKELWEKLSERGVHILVRGTPEYPERVNRVLGETAPPVLYVIGNTDILNTSSVGFCGSRKASEKGLQVAQKCARILAEEKINVVSGYAHGVDMAAHVGALEGKGTTTLVLAEGILHFRIKEQVRPWLSENDLNNVVIVSEFPPMLPWKAHNAMARNRTICALSNAMVVVESGTEGGTFEAGKTCLALKQPLFCVEYAQPAESAAGNPYLLQHGAISLRQTKEGKPNLNRLLEIVRSQPANNCNDLFKGK